MSSLRRSQSDTNFEDSITGIRETISATNVQQQQQQQQRLPFHYQNPTNASQTSVSQSSIDTRPRDLVPSDHGALDLRYRYYSRLDPRSNSTLAMPTHVVPANFFSIIPFEELDPKQGSIVTIFSIWNTMMGTALLSMPWALEQAGIALGAVLIVGVAILAFYTAYRVVDSPAHTGVVDKVEMLEFSDVTRYYFGKFGERLAIGFSLATLLGATIVYWVLMSNFLYFTGLAVRDSLRSNYSEWIDVNQSSSSCIVICSKTPPHEQIVEHDVFNRIWQLRLTVPFFLVILVFPLLNFKSPTFFTKFNGLGTISVLYLFAFVTTKAVKCGIHMEARFNVAMAKADFPALTGTLSLSFFIHNCILSVLKNQREPKNNVRDLSYAYVLVALTYSFVAVLFYISFPIDKTCIADNFLNNFGTDDMLSAVARLFLLFQMITVYPLLTFLIRVQFFSSLSLNSYPGLKSVIAFNLFVITLGILFAIFLPSVGVILRFVGSVTGMIYVFTLPCMVYLKQLKREGRLRTYHLVIHGVIIVLGLANLISQFVMIH